MLWTPLEIGGGGVVRLVGGVGAVMLGIRIR